MAVFNKRARGASGPIKVTTVPPPSLSLPQRREIQKLIKKAEARSEELKKGVRAYPGTAIQKNVIKSFNIFDTLTPGVSGNSSVIGNEFHLRYIDVTLAFLNAWTDINDQKIVTVALVKSTKYVAGTASLANADLLVDGTDLSPDPMFDKDKCTVVWRKVLKNTPQLANTLPATSLTHFNHRIKLDRKLSFKNIPTTVDLEKGNYYIVFWLYSVNSAPGTSAGTFQGGTVSYYSDA